MVGDTTKIKQARRPRKGGGGEANETKFNQPCRAIAGKNTRIVTTARMIEVRFPVGPTCLYGIAIAF